MTLFMSQIFLFVFFLQICNVDLQVSIFNSLCVIELIQFSLRDSSCLIQKKEKCLKS